MFLILKSLSVMKVGPRPLYNRCFFLCCVFHGPGLTRMLLSEWAAEKGMVRRARDSTPYFYQVYLNRGPSYL
jgi:hypothetical protein